LLSVAHAQTIPQIRNLDAAPLVEEVRVAVRAQGGDLDRQHAHLVFAFSTSHFGDDAGHGEAMRRAAAQLARELLVPGDRYSVAAWEMEVWDWKGPLTVAGKDAAGRGAEVAAHFPTTHRTGSTGGHDTEQAIVDLDARVKQTAMAHRGAAVLVLLTNAEASMNATDRRAVGANDPAYLAAMENLVRRPARRISFEAERTGGRGDWVPRQMDALVIVPERFAGGAVAGGTRAALLGGATTGDQRPTTTSSDPRPDRGGFPLWPILGGLVAIAIGVAWALRGRGAAVGAGGGLKAMQVGDRRVGLDGVPDGHVWRLVGPRFTGGGPQDITVGRPEEQAPAVVLGQVTVRRGELSLEALGDQVVLVSDDGTEGRRFSLPRGQRTFTLRGQHVTNPALPPEHFEVRIPVVVE
jgi:hypothetical protein